MSKGYNRPMSPGAGGMMDKLRRMQEQLAEAQAKLADETVTTTVGGGAIKVTMTGDQHCTNIEIDPEMLKTADAEMLQEMLQSGINMALDQSRQLAATKLGPLTGGLGI
jgi:DNA-binding YbaB/EbfC family protein